MYASKKKQLIWLHYSFTWFCRYNGSLTYPPCTKGVTWYVFTEPVIVARESSEHLYTLASKSQDAISGRMSLKNNRRPALKRYNRTVFRSFSINDNVIQMQQNAKVFNNIMQAILDPTFETIQQYKNKDKHEVEKAAYSNHLNLKLGQQKVISNTARNLAAIAKNRPLKLQLDRISNSINLTKKEPRYFYRKLSARTDGSRSFSGVSFLNVCSWLYVPVVTFSFKYM